ncbi:MAG TPA: outer membrane lipoprotein-sorting protein [Chitinophagaceae bacterium]|nr:outer membrane lipoprotein-sorting protein [Chitinophagaceae bacterium]
MRKILLALFCFIVAAAQAQTADEVIQKYSAAIGGLDAFNAVKTVKMTGNVSVQGMDLPLTIQIVNGKAMRNDVEVMGQIIINAYKDGKGWTVNPLTGANSATEVTGAPLNDLKNQSSLASPLMDYKARGSQVELEGQEDVEGVKCYKIKLTRKDDGNVSTYFINTTDYLPIKFVESKELQGQTFDVESYFSDYKDFNGMKFSMTRTQKVEGQVLQEIKLTDIQFNTAIDDKVFNMPK